MHYLSVNIEGVVWKLKIVFQAGVFNDFTDAGIMKFHDFTTGSVDEMIVLHGGKGFFILGNVFAKPVFYNKFAFNQEVDGVV